MTKEEHERLALLEALLLHAKIAVPWMVNTLRHATEELNGCYSDELKHSIELNEYLKVL